MEKILAEQNRHWASQTYDHLIQRACVPELIHLLELKEIMVLLGVRRCGKTTIFRLLINHLMQANDSKSILYVNLDDPFFDDVAFDAKSLYKIIEQAERFTQTKVQYLFLDEIQNIKNWEKFVKSIYDSESYKKIFIAGSNLDLLQGDYAKLLSGRCIEQFVYPLSIQEIFLHHGVTDQFTLVQQKHKALSLLDSLLAYGGFSEPFLHQDESLKRKILVNYYDTILLKDCIAQDHVRDARLIRELAHYLITNVTATYSYHSLKKLLASNEHTLKDYVATLTSGFLFDELKSFSFSLKEQTKSKKKIYCADNGLISSVVFSFSSNSGKLFENLVYCELKKAGCEEIYFLNETKECDFIVKYKNKILPIQACYALNNDNRKREIQGLQYAMEKTNATKGIIVTFDQEEGPSDGVYITSISKLFISNRWEEFL